MKKDNSDLDEYYFREGCFITELWNNDRDREVSIARVRLPVGGKTRCHCLINTTERYMILQGKAILTTEKQQLHLTANDVAIVAEGERQSIENIGEEELLCLVICHPRFEESHYIECTHE